MSTAPVFEHASATPLALVPVKSATLPVPLDAPRTLVVYDAPPVMSGTGRLVFAWRVQMADGEYFDLTCGVSTLDGADEFMAARRRRYPTLELLDLRGKPELVRDREYWIARAAEEPRP